MHRMKVMADGMIMESGYLKPLQPADIRAYYDSHLSAYRELDLSLIFIPFYKTPEKHNDPKRHQQLTEPEALSLCQS